MIKDDYSEVKLPRSVKAYFKLIRPYTVLIAFVAGLFVYFAVLGKLDIVGVMVAMTFASVQAFGQIMNQANEKEIEIDRENGKVYRPLVSGDMTIKDAKRVALIFVIVAMTMSIFVNVKFFMLTAVMLFLAYSYTEEPFRVKRICLLNNAHQAFARGFIPLFSVAYAFSQLTSDILIYSFAVGIWVFGAQTTKDFNDVEGDYKHRIFTFPVVLGHEGARNLMLVFMMMSFVVLVLQRYLLSLVIIFVSIAIYFTVDEDTITENNKAWTLYYIGLGLWFMLLALDKWVM